MLASDIQQRVDAKHGRRAYKILIHADTDIRVVSKQKVKHLSCGLVWRPQLNNLCAGSGCPTCGKSRRGRASRLSDAEYRKKLKRKFKGSIVALEPCRGSTVPLKHKCSAGHRFKNTPNKILHTKIGCRQCSYDRRGAVRRFTLVDIEELVRSTHGSKFELSNTKGVAQIANVQCLDCGHNFRAAPSRLAASKYGCKVCFERLNVTSRCVLKPYRLGKALITVQGFEGLCLDYLQEGKGIAAKSIVAGQENSANIPVIYYVQERQSRFHLPDIYIPSLDWIVEVKSKYTFGFNSEGRSFFERNKAKMLAGRESGHRYTIMVFSETGKRIKLPRRWYMMSHIQFLQQVQP